MDDITIFMSFSDVRYVGDYLRSIANQSYGKNRLHLFIDVSQLGKDGQALIDQFLARHRKNYGSMLVHCSSTNDARQDALNYARFNETDYFTADQNVILHSLTLRRLHGYDLDVVGPLLIADGVYSNFHADVTDNGYYKGSDRYFQILNRELRGILNVPVVNGCYLIRSDRLKYVTYDDGSGRLEYVIFSDVMRRNLVLQYIDNTFNYGVMINYENKTTEEIAELDILNNKEFYLDVDKRRKRAVICDADWLSSYVITEHLYLFKLLRDLYNFHIINCKRLDISNLDIIVDLDSYDVILVAYHIHARIPLHLVSSYKIYKIDDLENDPYYTELVRYYIKQADMVISPYAYVFPEYYDHDNVQWIPYSCALEGLIDFSTIEFNTNPIMKVLQSGNVGSSYPFRQYVATLEHENIERLAHQGWKHDSTSEAVVRTKYYEKLNEYICCFTDALTFRYILLKNFEIAAVGSLLLTDKVIEKEMNQLGFVDYETCIFCNQETFLQKISWILDKSNREQVDQIRRQGMDLVRQRHMTRHRALQIHNLVNDRARVR